MATSANALSYKAKIPCSGAADRVHALAMLCFLAVVPALCETITMEGTEVLIMRNSAALPWKIYDAACTGAARALHAIVCSNASRLRCTWAWLYNRQLLDTPDAASMALSKLATFGWKLHHP